MLGGNNCQHLIIAITLQVSTYAYSRLAGDRDMHSSRECDDLDYIVTEAINCAGEMNEQLAQEWRLYFESFDAARVSLSLSISRGLLLWLLSLKAVVRDSHCELDEGVETNWKQKQKKKKRERCAFYGSASYRCGWFATNGVFPKFPAVEFGGELGMLESFLLYSIFPPPFDAFFYSRLEKEIVHQSPLILSYSRRREFFYHCYDIVYRVGVIIIICVMLIEW